MGKERAQNFDTAICHGEDPRYDRPCPKRVGGDENTGNPGIDMISRIETEAIEAATGEKQYKCGACGCPLANLSAVGVIPDNCPRSQAHK